MIAKYIADIHVHPTLKPLYQSSERNIWEQIDKSPTCKDLPNFLKKALKPLSNFSQSNLNKCIKNDTLIIRCMIISLYPPEVNLFDLRDLMECLVSEKNEINLGSCASGFHQTIVEKYSKLIENNIEIDYFKILKKEYSYLVGQSQINPNPDYAFAIAGDYKEYKRIINNSPNTIVGIISIEGLHSLVKYDSYTILKELPFSSVSNPQSTAYKDFHKQFEENIKKIKNWNSGRHCPLFITFTHHFWNLLAGHARSYEGAARTFAINQNQQINEGFSLIGREVLRMLLDKNNGRRILIDIKHMSSRSRRDFYYALKTEYEIHRDLVPIICSHGAVNGFSNLADNDQIDNSNKIEGYYFNTWSINLYDEDIKNIYYSNGLIGIILFPERLGGAIPRRIFKNNTITVDQKKTEIVKLIMANIFHIIRVCDTREAWDIVCIGSDFDGMISSFSEYQVLTDFDTLSLQMFQFLHSLPTDKYTGKTDNYPAFTKAEYKRLMFNYTPKEIIEKITNGNVDLFLSRYFNEEYLLHANPIV